MFGTVKLRKTDRMFTKYIRQRDDYTCQNPNCRRVYPQDDCRNLVVSHLWGRGRENTRFDDDNCIALCHCNCHRYLGHGEGRREYEAFMIERLGGTGYDLLMVRAHTSKGRDDKMDEFIIRKKMEALEQSKMKALVGGKV